VTDHQVHRPDGRRIECEVAIKASPEEVWSAWADPVKLAQWFVDDARGEARPGGTITWIFRDFNMEIPYPVTVAEPGRRLVLAGELPNRGPFALEILIEVRGGVTVLRLVNSGFLNGTEWDEEYEGVRSGWNGALAVLKHYLENFYGRPKRTVLVVQPVATTYERVYPFFKQSGSLAQWLTESGGFGAVGSPVSLVLKGGMRLSGRVLADTGRELTVSWVERRATLELKAFAGPSGKRIVGVRLLGWELSDADAGELRAVLAGAVGRLAQAVTL